MANRNLPADLRKFTQPLNIEGGQPNVSVITLFDLVYKHGYDLLAAEELLATMQNPEWIYVRGVGAVKGASKKELFYLTQGTLKEILSSKVWRIDLIQSYHLLGPEPQSGNIDLAFILPNGKLPGLVIISDDWFEGECRCLLTFDTRLINAVRLVTQNLILAPYLDVSLLSGACGFGITRDQLCELMPQINYLLEPCGVSLKEVFPGIYVHEYGNWHTILNRSLRYKMLAPSQSASHLMIAAEASQVEVLIHCNIYEDIDLGIALPPTHNHLVTIDAKIHYSTDVTMQEAIIFTCPDDLRDLLGQALINLASSNMYTRTSISDPRNIFGALLEQLSEQGYTLDLERSRTVGLPIPSMPLLNLQHKAGGRKSNTNNPQVKR